MTRTHASLLIALALCTGSVRAGDLATFENACVEIGFTKKTQAFGECVLELMQRSNSKNKQRDSANNERGDGTPDHETCKKYGLLPPSAGYAQCRMQIDQIRQQADAKQKEDSRKEGEALMLFGLGLLSGQQNAPTQSPSSNGLRVYTLPNGRSMTCNTVGAFTNCN